MTESVFGLIAIVVLVLANGFFVAAEFSLVSVRPTRVEELVRGGTPGAAAVKHAIKDTDRFIAATQLGITLASLGLGWIGEPALAHLIEPLLAFLPGEIAGEAAHIVAGTAIAFAIITFMHVIVGELMPKSIALMNPERTALFIAGPTLIAETIFRPFIWLMNGTGNFLLRLIRVRPAAHGTLHSIEELKMIAEASEQGGLIEPDEREMIHAVFDLRDTSARQVMVPRMEMVTVDATATLEEALDVAAHSSLTKFPVYENDPDHVVGVLHVKDVVRVIHESIEQDAGRAALAKTAREIMREALFVPETVRVDDLIARMRRQKQHMAILLDEFGGTAGLVTLEDLVEELFGDVQDEFTIEEPDLVPRADGSISVSGLMLIEDVNDALGVNLVDQNSDTIAGYVLSRLGRIPAAGDSLQADGVHFRVERMDGLRIDRIGIRVDERRKTKDE
ncbi:MAG TPA: hemolysin family protein [Anaerolineae bacterium]|nr:hemolysin family protein [Anaerolineae bacterium]